MKCSIFFLLAIIALGVGCKKGDNRPANTFVGKWKLTAQKISAGGPAYWVAVSNNENNYVQFNNNGTFKSDAFLLYKYSKYTVKDSATVTMSKNDTIQNFSYQFKKQDTLLMSPAGPIFCFEGCTFKFVRQK